MTEMRERIARAIDPMRWSEIDQMSPLDFARAILIGAEMLRVAAVLRTMREPTEAMISGLAALDYTADHHEALEYWQAMIDAA